MRFYAGTQKKVFYIGYRVKHTKINRNMLIGRFGECSLTKLRERAIRVKLAVTDGHDPMLEQEEKRKKLEAEKSARVLVKDIVMEYYEKYSMTRKRASTQKSDMGQINRYVNPILGDYWVTELDLPKIIDFYEKVTAKTSYSTANRALQFVSSFWNWCELHGKLPLNTNPCSRVDKGTNEKQKHKRLSLDDYKKLIAALDAGFTESPYSPRMFRALKVLMFTGCRVTEITGLKKSEINFEERFIEFEKANKNDEGRHPLPLPAIEELKLAIAESRADSERVFPATRGNDNSLLDVRKALAWALNRAGLPQMQQHDFRRSFITIGTDALNIPIQAVSKAIGHSSVAVTEIYSEISEKKRLSTADAIALAIAG
jgi:integrase